MTRETRANLVFLCIFLAISLPGAVILFRKKLDPMSNRMSMPDSVRKRLAYMVPLNTPDEVTRFTPDLTAEWVNSTARERAGLEGMHTERWRPVVSENYELQFIGLSQGEAGSTVYLMLWNDDVPVGQAGLGVELSAEAGPATAGRVATLESLRLPDQVRKELKKDGFIQPPVSVAWAAVTFDRRLGTDEPLTLRVTYRTATGATVTRVRAFTHQS